jgi:hypothetical protein
MERWLSMTESSAIFCELYGRQNDSTNVGECGEEMDGWMDAWKVQRHGA